MLVANPVSPVSFVALSMAIGSGLVIYALARSRRLNPQLMLDIGLIFEVVGALCIGLIESSRFSAATAVHAGSLREREEFKMLERLRRNIPLAIWVGTQDPFFSVASVRETRDALVKRGSTVEITVMPGHDHWYYDLASQINQKAWEFLKGRELPADQQYRQYDYR